MPRMDEKKLHTHEFRPRGSSKNMRSKLLQKRFTGKTTEFSKHLHHIAIEKNILSELNRCILQISLKYIKLFQKYSLYWYYAHLILLQNYMTPPPLPPPPFSKILPFLEIQDVPTFHRSSRKTKVLNNSCNQFVYNFYRMFTKVVKCKPGIMLLNVFWSML